jgi:hypothetical protein
MILPNTIPKAYGPGGTESLLREVDGCIDALVKALRMLPRVHKDGSSECPFAEELFADKEAIQRELESLSGQLHKHYETATEELKRCKRNRNVIREDEGQLYGVAAQNAYERAQKASDEEAEKHRRLQRRIVQKQATVRGVLEHARGVSYTRPIRMPPSPRATKRELPPGDIRDKTVERPGNRELDDLGRAVSEEQRINHLI